jgi:hypothetical protein
MEPLREQNRLLIYRCFNVLNRQAELSAPQVMSYLMNWGDKFTSHQYVSVYWGQLSNALKKVFPFLEHEEHSSLEEENENVQYSVNSDLVSFHSFFFYLLVFF